MDFMELERQRGITIQVVCCVTCVCAVLDTAPPPLTLPSVSCYIHLMERH